MGKQSELCPGGMAAFWVVSGQSSCLAHICSDLESFLMVCLSAKLPKLPWLVFCSHSVFLIRIPPNVKQLREMVFTVLGQGRWFRSMVPRCC